MRKYKVIFNADKARYEFVDNKDNSVIFAHTKESLVKNFAQQYRKAMR